MLFMVDLLAAHYRDCAHLFELLKFTHMLASGQARHA